MWQRKRERSPLLYQSAYHTFQSIEFNRRVKYHIRPLKLHFQLMPLPLIYGRGAFLCRVCSSRAAAHCAKRSAQRTAARPFSKTRASQWPLFVMYALGAICLTGKTFLFGTPSARTTWNVFVIIVQRIVSVCKLSSINSRMLTVRVYLYTWYNNGYLDERGWALYYCATTAIARLLCSTWAVSSFTVRPIVVARWINIKMRAHRQFIVRELALYSFSASVNRRLRFVYSVNMFLYRVKGVNIRERVCVWKSVPMTHGAWSWLKSNYLRRLDSELFG